MRRTATFRWLVGGALLVSALVAGEPARAEGAGAVAPLTVDAVLASVEQSHPTLAASRRDLEGARGDRQAADGGFDLLLRSRAAGTPAGYYRHFRVDAMLEQATPLYGTTFFGGYRLGRGDVPVYDGKLLTNDLGEARVGATVPLLRNGSIDRRRASIARADLGEQGAERGVAAAQLDVKRMASVRYWDWVAANARAKLAMALMETAERRDAQIARRVEAGDVAPIERQENARAILQRSSQRVAFERALQQSAIELSLYYRDTNGAPVVSRPEAAPRLEPPSSWPIEPFERAVEGALSTRPDYARITLQKKQAKIEADLAQNQKLPALDVQVSASKDFGDGLASRRPVEIEAMVMFELPIQNRAARGRDRAAEAMVARIAEVERAARDRITADVRDAMSAIDLARARLLVARSEVDVSRDLERAEWARFAAGDTTLLVVNLREQATFEAQLREIEAMAECQRALVAYRAAVGALR